MQAAERPPLVMTESAEWQEAERRRKARIHRFVRQCGANIWGSDFLEILEQDIAGDALPASDRAGQG